MSLDWARLLSRPEICFPPRALEAAVRDRRVLITGAGGSIGTRLAELILSCGAGQLLLLDCHEASLFRLRQTLEAAFAGRELRYVLADVRDRLKVFQVFRRSRIDVVFHLAAYKHVPLSEDNADQVAAVNLLGTLNLLDAAREHGTSRLVYTSSDKAVTPLSAYAATKRIVEQLLLSLAEDNTRPGVRVVRLVNVFGTQGSAVETFIRQIREGLPITVTDPRMDRYWMTMREATHLLLAAAGRPAGGAILMLDVGEPVPIVETVRRVYALVHGGGEEPPIRVTGIRPGERLHEQLVRPDERVIATELPGLLEVWPLAAVAEARVWLAELERFREAGYEWDPADTKDWLLKLASCLVQDGRLSVGRLETGPGRGTVE